MSDKLKIQQEHLGENVIRVPPRRKTIRHRGLHGFIEYHPVKKVWSFVLKLVYPITHSGQMRTEEEAALEVKKLIDIAASGNNKHVRSVD